MGRYYIWTIGCQMNTADSERLGSALDQIGCQPVAAPEDADVIVLNSCVVRQGAEEKVVGRLTSLKPLKQAHRERTVVLMGCMVGPRHEELKRRFPFVDLFLRPQQYEPLLQAVAQREGACLDDIGPPVASHPKVAAFTPIIHGCDKFCAFCIIPYRRGRERSRPIPEMVDEVRHMVARGVKEVTLLGQNVDSYGHDLPGSPDLADLLTALDPIPGLVRIRFLTSHPSDMSDRIIDAVADLPKVCEFINLPAQAGDDDVLMSMRRGYTRADYLRLVDKIRRRIPGVGLTTDIIVGFCGETADQFRRTLDLMEEVRFDKVHVAAYSVRPGTIAARGMADDVPAEEKRRRLQAVEELQERIATEINARLVGETLEVMAEEFDTARELWQGRTRSNKLAHFKAHGVRPGDLVLVRVAEASPWYLKGEAVAAG
ncbi:MAG: tRNA (N6-isopentenyl adenosine(37)-C2)-methylthiotransferase MiaB [Dehalococcoidia bacterium]|nr:tRNA (N6-isopentenyl adenosine(37)-C2)-methylthiotransferase MiaB [Dehalococcoidia bacterium]